MRFYTLSIALLTISSCAFFEKKIEEKDFVARVHDAFLYRTDLKGMLPEKTSTEDSVTLTKSYIDNWVKQTLLVKNAEKNISVDMAEIEKQIKSYRTSLMVYEIEKTHIRNNLDTVVSEEEIMKYYNENQKNFELKKNIVRFIYVKLAKESPKLNKVRNWHKSTTPKDRIALEEYCYQYAVNFNIDDSTWFYFDELLKEVPIETYDEEIFLKNHRLIEAIDSLHVYFVNIKEFKIKESLSPLEFELEHIRSIIINKRKVELIKEMEENIYKAALKNGDFEVY